jgi:hypothetical protein
MDEATPGSERMSRQTSLPLAQACCQGSSVSYAAAAAAADRGGRAIDADDVRFFPLPISFILNCIILGWSKLTLVSGLVGFRLRSVCGERRVLRCGGCCDESRRAIVRTMCFLFSLSNLYFNHIFFR